ncbi:hypothetical protein ACSQ67_009784 [Phaseolus vulgaris]
MACSQLQKIETNVHLKASPNSSMMFFATGHTILPTFYLKKYKSVQIHKGEWGTVGSIISWNYTLDGKKVVAKEVVEGIDKENCKVSFKVLEGDLLGLYKSFKLNLQVTPKGNGKCGAMDTGV